MKQRKTKRNYTYRTMRDERAYGLAWYSGLWTSLRPILVVCASLVVVIGLVILFKKQITDLLESIFKEIEKQSKEVY